MDTIKRKLHISQDKHRVRMVAGVSGLEAPVKEPVKVQVSLPAPVRLHPQAGSRTAAAVPGGTPRCAHSPEQDGQTGTHGPNSDCRLIL